VNVLLCFVQLLFQQFDLVFHGFALLQHLISFSCQFVFLNFHLFQIPAGFVSFRRDFDEFLRQTNVLQSVLVRRAFWNPA